MPIALFPAASYQVQTEVIFRELRTELRRLLPDARIEHIGASSIPGAVSKGNLDLCVAVPAQDFLHTRQQIEALGFSPQDGELAAPQRCNLHASHYAVHVVVQLIETGSEHESLFTFRDALLNEPQLVAVYNAIKRESAPLDEQTYLENKAAFIRSVLASTATDATSVNPMPSPTAF